MAQAGDQRRPPKGQSGGSKANRPGAANGGAGKPAPKSPPATKASSKTPPRRPAGRESVAAARKSTGGSNRTQLIIGGVAVLVIGAIIAFGLVLNKQQTAVQAEGYGGSTQSVATESGGVVTVSKSGGGAPSLTLDIYEDALCPICAEFERQYGQQINKAIDSGALAVNYHMLNFLNPSSSSGDYSTRAAAALLCVAQQSGTQAGVYLAFHSALFSADHQPEEGGSSDLSNTELASLASSTNASAEATACVSSGQNVAAAEAAATSSSATLSAATGGRVATPTIVKDGVPVPLSVNWLGDLLGQS